MISNRALLTSVFSAVFLQNEIRFMSVSAVHVKEGTEKASSIIRKSIGLKSPKNLWWAKQVTPEYYVAGRLSRRQIQYASEGGFKSVVSLFTYKDKKNCCLGVDYLPSTTEMDSYAKEAGLHFRTVLYSSKVSSAVQSVSDLEESLKNLPKPALLFSDRGYSMTFTLLMYLLKSQINTDFTVENAVAVSELLGMDFSLKCTNRVLCNVTGENIDFPKLDSLPKQWLSYWLATPVYKNWFIAGQILDSHIPLIKQAGFKSVVNLRAGTTHKGKPSQETVTLLNIKDGSRTYGDDTLGPRQSLETLRQQIIDPSKDNSYVSPNSSQNFATTNRAEFGDLIGYNEEIEKLSFRKAGFPYYHVPVVNSEPFSAELFSLYQPELMDSVNRGPVLIHCASSKRAGYIAVLAAAVQHHHDLAWALSKLSQLGMAISPSKKPDIYEMYVNVLTKKGNKTHCHSNKSGKICTECN
ncbi:uncharacterized protein LOC133190094 [Saccostrea echinata]|uniref:uncharacterized protein LOC133190094 n=1 Tax=Saccostrea echinata TaxID=191078 RepID=UPI002A809D62|nr:uncharacterized protein LOC133190094 [Saccostrea echinata]